MSKKSTVPLWVDVKQSRYLLFFIYLIHSFAAINCLILPLLIIVKVLLLLLLGCSLCFYLKRYTRGYYTFSLRQTEALSWELIEHHQQTHLRILGASVLTSFMIVLQAKAGKKQHSLLVCLDAVSADKYRQLFVALKIMNLSQATG